MLLLAFVGMEIWQNNYWQNNFTNRGLSGEMVLPLVILLQTLRCLRWGRLPERSGGLSQYVRLALKPGVEIL